MEVQMPWDEWSEWVVPRRHDRPQLRPYQKRRAARESDNKIQELIDEYGDVTNEDRADLSELGIE